jgi:large subunit ribosomal protein L29
MKQEDIKAMNDQELVDKLTEERGLLTKMKINHAVSPIENPMKIRHSRRAIARLVSEQTKRKNTSK